MIAGLSSAVAHKAARAVATVNVMQYDFMVYSLGSADRQNQSVRACEQ